MQGVLDGKAIAITGAGRGLGEAYARLAATEGAKVVVNDIEISEAERVAEQIRSAGGVALAEGSDICSWRGAQAVIHTCVSAYGSLDGFVNNAGLFQMGAPEEETEERIRKIVEVNVIGTMFCGYAALRQMLRQGSGSLINITSGAHAGIKSMSAYAGTKGAVASVTYAWALDTEGTRVRVNAISPIAHTRMAHARQTFRRNHGISKEDPEQPGPEHVAPLAVYLLSDLSEAVHGQTVRIQGNSLSLMTHPGTVEPGFASAKWSVPLIAAAFEQRLAGQQLPCGVHSYRVQLCGDASTG